LLEVLYQDDHVLVVNKPSGLAVHRGEAQDPVYALTLARDLAGRFVHPVHRLDRATSGALLFVFDKTHLGPFQRQFADIEPSAEPVSPARVEELPFLSPGAGGVEPLPNGFSPLSPSAGRGGQGGEGPIRRAEKVYWALVRGVPPQSGMIDYALARLDGPGERLAARTEFRRLATFETYALMEARPATGRRHQIRRHFKHLSHPLIGDTTYGKGLCNRYFRTLCGLRRLALHAALLGFDHPVDGRRIVCPAPLPADLGDPLRAIGLPVDELWRDLAALRQEIA
jgi:tRNA pseudouridine65 synthase